MAKWFLIVVVFLVSCSSTNKKGLYQPVASVGGYGYFKPSEKKICNCKKNSTQVVKEKLEEEGYSQMSDGITSSVVCAIVSAMIAQPLIQKLAAYGLVGSLAWTLAGLIKIAAATVLPYIIFVIIGSSHIRKRMLITC